MYTRLAALEKIVHFRRKIQGYANQTTYRMTHYHYLHALHICLIIVHNIKSFDWLPRKWVNKSMILTMKQRFDRAIPHKYPKKHSYIGICSTVRNVTNVDIFHNSNPYRLITIIIIYCLKLQLNHLNHPPPPSSYTTNYNSPCK